MRKNAVMKLFTLLMALLLVVAAIPTGNITAQAASKKPGAVTKVTKSEVNPTTVTIAYNKAKNAKGYQVRAYKGKKLVKSAKTKNTSYMVKGLSAETKYTIKVRAYNGSKYGKEKSITVKTETKNLAVTELRASNVTEDSVKITFKKAKNAKGYQIRVYKGGTQVSGEKTSKTSYTVSNLSGGTQYTIKVRAYKGRKYGKEKSVIVTTSAPAEKTEEPSSEDPNSGIVMPGESTSTGDALVAEYNAYVAYEAEQWKNLKVNQFPNPQTEFEKALWYGPYLHMPMMFQYNAAYNDKYNLFKYKAGTPNALADFFVDVFNAFGLPAERYYSMLEDAEKYGLDINVDETVAAFIYTFNGHQMVDAYGTDFQMRGNRAGYDLVYCEKTIETWEIVAHCPHCGKEITGKASGMDVYGLYGGAVSGLDVTGTCTVYCGDRYGSSHECKPYKLPEHPGSDKFEMVTPNVRIAFQRTLTKEEMLASHRIELTEVDIVYDDYMQQIPEGAIVE